MREATYTDKKGRKFQVWLPDEASDKDAAMGIPIGPPSLESLGLPLELEVKLHNELYARKLWRSRDVKQRRHDIVTAIQAVLRLDVQKIVDLYPEREVIHA
jgi:hypothetical protein